MRKSIILAVVALVAMVNVACGVGSLGGQPSAPTSAPAASNADQVAQLQATIAAMQAQATAAPVASAPTSAPAAPETAPTAAGTAQETLPTSAPTVAPAAPAAQPVSQPQTAPPMLLVLDSSGSMLLDDGTGQTKLQAAKNALNSLVTALPEGAPVGLRVYGHRYPNTDKPNGCQDTELIAPIAPLNKSSMNAAIARFDAKGYTPISLSLEEGFKDLPPEGPRTLVLVSDGEETCDRPPCPVAADLKAKGVDFIVDAVGFQVDDKTRTQLRCIAEKTGGQYRDAANADELARQLAEISQRALRQYQAVGGEIAGGADFRSALALQPGNYIEKLRTGEAVYYKVAIPEGKRLRFLATLIPAQGSKGVVSLDATIYDTTRQSQGLANASLDLLNRPTETGTAALELDPAKPTYGLNALPYGEYYVSLAFDQVTGFPETDQLDFTVEIAVEFF